MAIPEIPAFHALLTSLSRTDPKDLSYNSLTIVTEINALFVDGRSITYKGEQIWYKTVTGISIDTVIQRIKVELAFLKHPISDQIARTVLLLLTYHPEQKTNGVAALNSILSYKTSATASQFFILKKIKVEGFNPISFGDFHFDLMDAKRFAYKCEKAGSNYYELYKDGYHQQPWVERKKFATVILNWHSFLKMVKPGYQIEYLEAVLHYFESVAAILFDDFWFQFNEQQNLHVSIGLGALPERAIRENMGSTAVCIFLDIDTDGRNRGYVVPVQVGRFEMSIPNDLGLKVRGLYDLVENNYRFPGKATGEIFETIKTFIKFVAKGYRHLDEEKKDDGFLHFVIALDLLFGDKQESTKTVTNRCALLTFGKMGIAYSEQKKLMAKIYDSRSKYVHAGMSVQDDYIDQIKPICQEVLYCLLQVHRNNAERAEPLTIDLWKRKLDFAWNALEAEELLTEDFKAEIGLANPN